MKFNYAAERNRFETLWKILRKQYTDEGMSEENIEKMYQFDKAQFNADRVFAEHTYPLSPAYNLDSDADEGEVSLSVRDLKCLTTEYDALGGHSRYWWFEELTDPRLVAALPYLSIADKEILTLKIVEQRTVREIADIFGVSHPAISQRLKKLSVLFITASRQN